MKNINLDTCKYMRIGNSKRVIPFSPEIPEGNVKIKYYLISKLTSLDNEFNNNDNIVSIDLSNLDTSEITNIDGAFNGCDNLNYLNLGNLSINVSYVSAFDGLKEEIVLDGNNDLVDEADYIIRPPKDYLISSIPSSNTIVIAVEDNGKYDFYANQDNIRIPVVLSNWDNYDLFVESKDMTNLELPYFLNTQHCTELGVPNESDFISKNNKNSIVNTPRLCLADDVDISIEIPEDLHIDYFVIHASGHNGAKTEFEYVYNEEDGIYLESKQVIAASEGTSDIVVRCRDKRAKYVIHNGTLDNCKKVWVSFDFYKYNERTRIPDLPEVEHVNPPIPDSAYNILNEPIEKLSTNINALSGICMPSDSSCLYGVSDTYGLYRIGLDGTSELIVSPQKDLEGLCFGPNEDLYACVENEQQIIRFNKESDYKEWEIISSVDSDKLLDIMKEYNNGFEGISYNSSTNSFYLGNQFKPISITEYSIENGVAENPIILKFDNNIGGTTEIGDIQYDEFLDCFWVIDSRSSNIYKYNKEGNVIESFKTNIGSKPNTESLFIDFTNCKLYVGCDNATGDIYVFDFDVKHIIEEPTEEIEN